MKTGPRSGEKGESYKLKQEGRGVVRMIGKTGEGNKDLSGDLTMGQSRKMRKP